MYRIFCESYKNYIKLNHGEDFRSVIVKPFTLIVNIDMFDAEKENESLIYRKLCDLLYFMEQNIESYPRFKAFLWTIEARGIKAMHCGVEDEEILLEQAKIINMFLKLAYWDVA